MHRAEKVFYQTDTRIDHRHTAAETQKQEGRVFYGRRVRFIMLEEKQIKILMTMHELEQSLAEMYALFAEKFPEHRELFMTLVKEEHEHAEAVQKLYGLTYKKEASFSEGSTRLAAIEAIIEYVKKTCEIGRHDGLTSEQALELSRDIEKSLIAKNIFNHFRVRPEYSAMLNYLRSGSEHHVQLVHGEIERSKKKRYA
jgi:hypothetical protein